MTRHAESKHLVLDAIAAWFFERIANCERVRVFENDDCWAEVAAQD